MDQRQTAEHTFESIVGQDLVKRFLRRAWRQHRLPHALLFSGPEGVGKRSLMYATAKHLVTSDMEPDDEQAQRAIGKVERGTHPDVMVVEPTSASGQILRGQIDEMHDRAHYAPLECPHRIILIAPVEAMNPIAANNLLKLLEEPPPSLYVFLSTQQIHQVLTTIRSRCALLRCPPVEFGPLTEWLMAVARCPERPARAAAALSGGRPGLAIDLLTGDHEERRRRVCGELDLFHREGYPSVFRVGHNLLEATGSASEASAALLLWFRDLLVESLLSGGGAEGTPPTSRLDTEALLMNRDLADEIQEASKRFGPTGLAGALQALLDHNKDVGRPFIDAELLMEVLLTDMGIALKSG